MREIPKLYIGIDDYYIFAATSHMSRNFGFHCARISVRDATNHCKVCTTGGQNIRRAKSLKQFFCHRHFLERFRNKILRIWVKRLLECISREKHDIVSVQISCEISLWTSQIHDAKNIPQKLTEVQSMLEFSRTDSRGIRPRFPYHVGRCTSHAEALHHVMTRIGALSREFTHRIDKMSVPNRSPE